MTGPERHLDVLDPRFPISLTAEPKFSWDILRVWADPAFVIDETIRTLEQTARHEERYVTPAPPPPEPRFVPALAHDDTIIDFRLTDGDRFRPGDTLIPGAVEAATDMFLIRYDQADAREQARQQRRIGPRARRAIARWTGGT